MACPFCEPGRFDRDTIAAFDLFHNRGVHLTKQQARCMAALLGKNGTITTDTMIAAVWGEDSEPENSEGVLRVQISKCRKKIDEAGLPWQIRSTFGLGYALDKNDHGILRRVAVSLSFLLLCLPAVWKLA